MSTNTERQEVADIEQYNYEDLGHAQAWIDADIFPTLEEEDAEFFEQEGRPE